jgi:hypothetical protein
MEQYFRLTHSIIHGWIADIVKWPDKGASNGPTSTATHSSFPAVPFHATLRSCPARAELLLATLENLGQGLKRLNKVPGWQHNPLSLLQQGSTRWRQSLRPHRRPVQGHQPHHPVVKATTGSNFTTVPRLML